MGGLRVDALHRQHRDLTVARELRKPLYIAASVSQR
jgi:hypothetical protein